MDASAVIHMTKFSFFPDARFNFTELVFEAVQSRQAQKAHCKGKDMAVREAVHAHAGLASNLKLPVSASNWKTLRPIIALLMPAFWFGVIKGLWGTCKVP